METGENERSYTWTSLSLASLEKCMPSALKKRYREITEPKLEETNAFFVPYGRSTTNQIFSLQQNFEKSWKYAKEV